MMVAASFPSSRFDSPSTAFNRPIRPIQRTHSPSRSDRANIPLARPPGMGQSQTAIPMTVCGTLAVASSHAEDKTCTDLLLRCRLFHSSSTPCRPNPRIMNVRRAALRLFFSLRRTGPLDGARVPGIVTSCNTSVGHDLQMAFSRKRSLRYLPIGTHGRRGRLCISMGCVLPLLLRRFLCAPPTMMTTFSHDRYPWLRRTKKTSGKLRDSFWQGDI